MKSDLSKNKRSRLCVILWAVAGFVMLAALAEGIGIFRAFGKRASMVKEALLQTSPDANDMEEYFAASKAMAETLKKDNLFAPPPPEQHPVGSVDGIMGDSVFIKGNWYQVGDKVGDAEVIAIYPTKVTVKWKGEEKDFAPIASISAPQGSPGIKPRVSKRAPGPPSDGKGPMRREIGGMDRRARKGGFSGPGFDLSEEQRNAWREKFMNMSPGERMETAQKWQEMSDEERQEAMNELSQ